jgi:hypothetical protein
VTEENVPRSEHMIIPADNIIPNNNSVALVLEQTIPTERPPLVGEVSAYFLDRGVSRSLRGGTPNAVILVL